MLYGLEQSKDTSLPSLTFHKRFKPFVEDELENIVLHNNLFVATPINLMSRLTNSLQKILIKIVKILSSLGRREDL